VSHVFSDPGGDPLLFFRGSWGAVAPAAGRDGSAAGGGTAGR
jgi:hypothetical protein